MGCLLPDEVVDQDGNAVCDRPPEYVPPAP